MKIKALRNFGFLGKHVEAGTEIDVSPEDFGGTYEDFKSAGLIEEVGVSGANEPTPEPSSAEPDPITQAPKTKTRKRTDAPVTEAAKS